MHRQSLLALGVSLLVGCAGQDGENNDRARATADPSAGCVKRWNSETNAMRAQLAGFSRWQDAAVLVTTDTPRTTERVVGGTQVEIKPGDCIVAYADKGIAWVVHPGTNEWVAVGLALSSNLGSVYEQAQQSPTALANPDGSIPLSTGDLKVGGHEAKENQPDTGRPGTPGEDAVARVGDTRISRSTYQHWADIAAVGPSSPEKDEAPPDAARSPRSRAMQFVITAQWIEDEATRLGLTVSDREVRTRFEKQRRTSFSTSGEYERFLRESKMSEDDLRYRVRLDLLSQKTRAHVTQAVASDRRNEALSDYVAAFRRRYRRQTFCARNYVVRECGNARK